MKKFNLCLLICCLVLCVSSTVFGATFYDTKGTQYEGVVERISELGIINGISENTFAPNKGITRAELAKMIVYTRGLKDYADSISYTQTFSDVGKDHWAKNYIRVAADLELLKGYDDGTFKPEKEVSYAETVAIVLRILGYNNIDENVTPWYSGYTKKMFELRLNKGMSTFSYFTASAKRGDVAVLWWNMLVSDKWAVSSENAQSGFTYTYSDITQLEELFPSYRNISGTVRGITGESGDMIVVDIGGKEYTTASDFQIYALGATASGVYDKDEGIMYGFSIDDEISDYKLVSGPIFYLEECGYNLKKAKSKASYGSMNSANFAYLIVSKTDDVIYRAVYVDASNSTVVNEIKVDSKTKKDDEETNRKVYINGEEYTNTDAVVIRNGKKVEWKSLSKGVVLTELIKDSLYTYETKTIDGEITDYKDLENLYIDGDKYIVASNCVYTIDGDKEEYSYTDDMSVKKMDKLVARDTIVYLNIAEEIVKIAFGEYSEENTDKKYEDSEYQFVYITSISGTSKENQVAIRGVNINGEKVYYEISGKVSCGVGDMVALSKISSKKAGKCEVVSKSQKFNEIALLYDTDNEFYNDAFGEYVLTDETIIYKVTKKYANNSLSKVEECNVYKVDSVNKLGELDKYKFHIFYNEDMEIDILIAEMGLNETTYRVAIISEILADKSANKEYNKNNNEIMEVASARMYILDTVATRYNIISGDALEGELVTFDVKEDSELITIKERFRTAFIGYKKDICVERVNGKTAEIKGSDEVLNLNESTFEYNEKIYDFLEYKFIFANVSKLGKNDEWIFTSAKFVDKEDISLRAGDRIVFDELSGIVVIYRGYKD